RDPLPLARRQPRATLADHGVVAGGQSLDELVRACHVCRRADGAVARVRRGITNVLADARAEEERLLQHQRDPVPETRHLYATQVDAVDGDRSEVRIEEP